MANTPARNKKEAVQRIAAARETLRFFGVEGIGVFGSFASGQQTPSSDIDILVEFSEQQHSFDNFMELSFFLEELLGRQVEMVTPESLSPHLGPHILREVERVSLAA